MWDASSWATQAAGGERQTLIVRFHGPRLADSKRAKPQILVGAELYGEFSAAVPTWAKDLHKAWAKGCRRHVFSRAPWRYICALHQGCQVEESSAFVDLVVVIQREPRVPASRPPVAQGDLPPLNATDIEAGLARLFDYAPVAIAVLHLQEGVLRYASVNRAYEAMVGAQDLTGKAFGSLFTLDPQYTHDLEQRVLEVVHTSCRQELRQAAIHLDWHREGTAFTQYFDLVLEPLRGCSGPTAGVSLFAYNVSEQVIARRDAEQREAYFRHLADSLSQIVWTCDHNGHVDWLNARWFSYVGVAAGDAHALELEHHLHPDDVEMMRTVWAQALQHGESFAAETRLRDKSGAYRWFLVQVRPIKDEASGLMRWFGSSTDVHDQKSNSQAMTDLLENMSDGFFVIDGDWIIRHTNKRHIELTGIAKEAQIGRSMQSVFFPSEAEKSSAYLQHCRKAKDERITISFDEYYPPLDMWTAVNLYPSGNDGLAIIYRNLSAERALQKNIEVEKQKFEAVFFDSPACMALLRGPDLIYEKVNARYQAVMGQRDLVGMKLNDAAPELKDQPFLELMRNVYHTGTPYVAHAMAADLAQYVGGPVSRFYFDFTYSRIVDGYGRPYGVYLHAVDITDKVLASCRADALAVSLTEAIHARDDFLSSASHELKTPVTSIKMQLQMTRRHVKPEEGKMPEAAKLAKTLDICGKQINRLAALIEDLLDVSRIAAGKMTFNYATTDVSALVSHVIEQFADHFEAAHCPLEVDIAKTPMVRCDAFRMEQVVVNLITNATKYGANSPIRICVRAQHGDGVLITVADGGMGISEAKQARIFERFERAVTHENVSGLGLGLFICKEIVQAHRGQISVSSALGKGSLFTVDLPAHTGN